MTGRLTPLAIAVTLVLAGSGCSTSSPAAAPQPPSPTPTSTSPVAASPTPSPPPAPEPVQGRVDVTVDDVTRTELNLPGDVAVDDAAVESFVAAVAGALDTHLTALQLGEDGVLAGSGLLDGVSPEVLAGVTTTLASPEQPVAEARYNVEVAVAGTPQWAQVEVEVVGEDGRAPTAGFVFVPARSDAKVVAASPGRSS